MVAIAFVLPYGTQIGWGSMLDVNLNKIGISQTTAGWLGFMAGIIGNICALLAGKFAEVFRRKMKIIIILFYTLSAPFFLVYQDYTVLGSIAMDYFNIRDLRNFGSHTTIL